MTGATAQSGKSLRERSRSRFHVALLLALGLLAGCAGPAFIGSWSTGLAELPAARGWLSLPIGDWILNDGLEAQALVLCPRASCAEPGFAALLAFDGARAAALERALAADEATLARAFAAPARKPGKDGRPPKIGSRLSVTRFAQDGAAALLVEIAADATGKRAFATLVSAREGARLRLAFAVAGSAEAARADAEAAWRSR